MDLLLEQKSEFTDRGLIRLPGFVPEERLRRAREAVYEVLLRDAPREGVPGLPVRMPSTPAVAAALKRSLAMQTLFDGIAPPIVDALLRGQPWPPPGPPSLLFTPPNCTDWAVPHCGWHTDFPRLPGAVLPGVQLFVMLDRVPPCGGGTLVVAGSHRLVNPPHRLSSALLRKELRREPYFRALMSPGGNRARFLTTPERVRDVEVQVLELCGEPGDAYVTDLRLLHAVAPNAAPLPRLMATQRCLLESAAAELLAHDPAHQVQSTGHQG